jgi:hypothetical protein
LLLNLSQLSSSSLFLLLLLLLQTQLLTLPHVLFYTAVCCTAKPKPKP